MSDMECPECGHEAWEHSDTMTSDGCLRGWVLSDDDGGYIHGDDPTDVCGCNLNDLQVARAALSASEAALAERHATINFLRGELAERSADYDDVLRERNEARAEVERLRGEKHQHCGVCGNCLLGPDPCACDDRIAAERQQIGEWYAKEHCVMAADYRCCYGNSDRDEWCLACCNADRIATGGFAATEETRKPHHCDRYVNPGCQVCWPDGGMREQPEDDNEGEGHGP